VYSQRYRDYFKIPKETHKTYVKNKNNNSQTKCAKVFCQKGNSPDLKLRSKITNK